MTIKKVDEEQGIVESSMFQINVEQYDLLGFDGNVLIASLWKDDENEWHITKRLYDSCAVEDMGEYYCDFKEIVNDFIQIVSEWLNDEMSYIKDMYDDLENDIEVEM